MNRKVTLAVATVLLALIGAAVVSQVLIRHDPELPQATADDLPVISVSAAIDARQSLDEASPLAVFGWFSFGPPHSCPAPSRVDGVRNQSEIELYCRRGEIVLAERPESGVEVKDTAESTSVRIRRLDGPWLDPYLGPLSTDQAIHPAATPPWTPHPIITVGHFRDHRAADCALENIAFCLNVFVVDHIASAGGVDRGPVQRIDLSRGAPKSTPEGVTKVASAELGPMSRVLGLANLRWTDVATYEDRAAPPIDDRTVWIVRILDRGPDGSVAPRLRSVLVDDATLDVLWMSE